MKIIRKLIPLLAGLVGIWVIGSFVGVMLNLSNADFWTRSLMWSLLASLLVMPGLVVLHHATQGRQKSVSDGEASSDEQSSSTHPSVQKQPPFVPEEEEEDVLWPETEKSRSPQK
jgi:type VI protein secretion system component VasK